LLKKKSQGLRGNGDMINRLSLPHIYLGFFSAMVISEIYKSID